jgi:hypothetical protein
VALVLVLLGIAGAAGLYGRDDTTTLASRGTPPAVPAGTDPIAAAPAGTAAGADGQPPASGAHPATSEPAPDGSSSAPAPATSQRPASGARPVSGGTGDAGPSPAAGTGAATPPPAPAAGPAGGAAQAGPPAKTPLRLAVVAPRDGFRGGEGADVVEAARRAVAAANRSRKAGGAPPVELVVVGAEDRSAIDALPGQVQALVGGFGVDRAPGGLPWVLPADPAVDGPGVIRAEQTPAEVGARLGADVASHRPEARVGVIVAGPAEAPMADGLARSVAVERVNAEADTTCEAEVAQLRRQRADVLAVAGPPALARRCAAAARTLGRPAELVLVLPSAAYDHLESDPAAQGARTFLGLPWPTSDESGARRFRAANGGDRAVRSYRALVTFAAVEAAVESFTATGSPAPASGRFRSDLYDIDGGANRAGAVVRANFGRWAAP